MRYFFWFSNEMMFWIGLLFTASLMIIFDEQSVVWLASGVWVLILEQTAMSPATSASCLSFPLIYRSIGYTHNRPIIRTMSITKNN